MHIPSFSASVLFHFSFEHKQNNSILPNLYSFLLFYPFDPLGRLLDPCWQHEAFAPSQQHAKRIQDLEQQLAAERVARVQVQHSQQHTCAGWCRQPLTSQ